MKTAQEIYTAYKTMPSLQLHQLRVAAVAKMVCESLTKPVDTNSVLLACLFHDMGNIIKSDLTYFPAFTEPEGLEYWQKIKEEYIQKYGTDHHAANVAIAREIGLPEKAQELIAGIGFSRMKEILHSGMEQKICEYGDLRVGPHGVLSMAERLEEGRKRYADTKTVRPYYIAQDAYLELSNAAEEIEKNIFADVHIAPSVIAEENIAPHIEGLRKYPVE